MSSAQGDPKNEPAPLSTFGLPTSGVVPVYDPQTGLKAASPDQAKRLAGLGYKIGPEAELEEEKNSTTAKVGAFLTSAGNLGSMGLLNIGLAASGRRGDLINASEAQEANPLSSGLGSATGIVGSVLGGGLAKGATSLGLKGLSGVLARQATTGLGASALQGVSDQITEDTILQNPLTAENLAASAFTDVLWNAAFNVAGHGIIKAPGAIRSAFGNLGDYAEQIGLVKRNMVKAPVVQGTEPILKGFTTKIESGIESSNESVRTGKVNLSGSESSKLATDDFSRSTIKATSADATDQTIKTATRTTKSGIAQKLEENLTGDVPLDINAVKEQEIPFGWDGHTAAQKKSVLRSAIDAQVAGDEVHTQMWNKIPELEIQYKKALKAGKEEEALKILREKEEYKDFLSDAIPRTIEDGAIIPGFKDLNDEYARASGNPLKDLKPFSFGVKVPEVKTKATKGPRVSENESTASSSRTKDAYSASLLEDVSNRVKTEGAESSSFKIDGSFKDVSKDAVKNKTTHSFRFQIPKAPAEYIPGDLKIPFGNLPSKIAAVGAFTGTGGAAFPIAGAMTAAQAAVHLLNHRETIGPIFQKLAGGMAKVTAPTLTYGGRVARAENKKSTVFNVKDYQAALDTVGAAASRPEVVKQAVKDKFPALNETHPEIVNQMTMTILKGVTALNEQAPKKPFDITLQAQSFKPTRAQQIEWMRKWRTLANPMEAVDQGNAQTVQTLNDVYPTWTNHVRDQITSQMQSSNKKLYGASARNISAFMGASVRLMNDPKALKRLQETAGPEPAKQDGGGMGKSNKSAKVSSQAATREATSVQLNQLEG